MKRQEFYTVKSPGKDLSVRVKDFNTPSIALALLSGESLHVGYYKPFRQFYIDFGVLNTEVVNLTFEYFNGTTWAPIPDFVDETENFLKSGFMYWHRPKDWKKTTIDTDELFYIRITVDADLSATTEVNGINVLFSNDADLIGLRSNIVSKHNNGKTWVQKHEAARNHIIQQLRNLGHRKVKTTEQTSIFTDTKEDNLEFSDLTQFDLFDPFELREASKFYVLSSIYLDELSDETDDKWERAGLRHDKKSDEAVSVFMLRIDNDDDGEEDVQENMGDTGINLSWA